METTTELKSITLASTHKALGAKMVPFAGYLMPLQYSAVTTEHIAVRKGVGIFDVSHMGEFFLIGPKALDLVQKISSNDASKLKVGACLLYTSPSPRDRQKSRMPSSA